AAPNRPDLHSNMLLALNYHDSHGPAEVFTQHRRWAELHADRFAPQQPPRPVPPRPDGKLRIGYLSADFRNHPVAGFLRAVLTHHDRTRFHITSYASVVRPDDVTRELERLSDDWRIVVGKTDDAVAQQIRTDGTDILVDTGGHTAGNRLLVFARQP